ncbi:hypothetical protein EUTSA_v10005453mg [Eutrema salsugineum]|uniref:RBR-type E3 ubiquitin transferase n=1 Tax=Eutrema salsugineum TaxID=72664 RepID=V4KRQ5_EUTSA|nr:probable E3 ubiquitin-protein ligase ARI3 [Eutrema salsugineum]ESQ32692.1 hypothetical protein EUTSA_v10005453mg [Eutrema salsugineum]
MDDDYLSFEEEEEEEEDNYEDYYNDDHAHEEVSSKKSTSQIITKESLVLAQKEVLARVMELLSVKENQARTLLIHYQWNVNKLIGVYGDRGKDSLFKSAGLTVFDPSLISSRKRKTMSCDICIEDDIPSSAMTRMECGHCFCNDCWKEHFTVNINEGKSKRITCMAHKCNAICDEDVVRKLVSPELAEKFDRFLVESYVEDNKMVKWCPSTPHCGNAIRKAEEDEEVEVECSCGLQFCFSCLSESHSPCSCLMWKLWRKKCEDESETVNWITVHTRVCPKCNKPVHRSDGCNLMTCICGQHFCWLCGGATGRDHTWTSISGHSCGRYKEDKVRQMERAKRDLNRYTHYYYHFKAHTDSSKLEDKRRKSILEKAEFISEKNDQLVFKDLTWLTDGVDLLFRSRRILSYSYPFAFYMFGEELFKDEMSDLDREMKKNLFEDQQQQLEGNVERLSKILEEPFDEYSEDDIKMMKNQLKFLCPVIDNLCKEMYKCIENDLLGPTQAGINHSIAPYRSKGIEKAIEFCADIC